MTQAGTSTNKSVFLQEWLTANPTGRDTDAAQAWQAAGNSGKISPSLFYKIKGEMGLNARYKKAAQSREKRATPSSKTSRPQANGRATTSTNHQSVQPQANGQRGSRSLVELEGDSDRLIFHIMAVDGLEEVEQLLRHARRVLVRSHDS